MQGRKAVHNPIPLDRDIAIRHRHLASIGDVVDCLGRLTS